MQTLSRVILGLGLFFLTTLRPVYGQAGWVDIDTNHNDAFVYADTTWLGTAGTGLFHIPAYAKTIILVPNSVDSWSVPSISAPLSGGRTDTLQLELNFPHFYRIESVPSGVDVYFTSNGSRSYLGTTPLEYVSEIALSGEFIFDKPGHVSRTVSPGAEIWNRHLVLLESVGQMDPISGSGSIAGVRSLKSNTSWLDYVAVGTSVVGGLLAVHYKTKADKLYDEYKESKDIGLKPDIEQFDLYSGVALGAMQVGLGVLAFRLIF